MKLLIYVVVVIALLAGLFQVFKPAPAPPMATGGPTVRSTVETPAATPAAAATAATLPEPAAADAPTTKVVDLVVAKGRLASGPNVVAVKQGDPVVFHVTSDVADELHLHGYNLHLKLRPGETATLEVNTTRMGRFTYELHHHDLELGALEVYPR